MSKTEKVKTIQKNSGKKFVIGEMTRSGSFNSKLH